MAYIIFQIVIAVIIILMLPIIFSKKNENEEASENNALRIKKIKWAIIISTVVGILGIILMKSGSNPPEVIDNGIQVSFKSSKFHAVLDKGAEFADSYVVFGKSKVQNTFFERIFFLMPLAKAKELSERYGDFSQCSNDGSPLAKEATKNYWVIAADTEVRNKIGKKAKSVFPVGSRRYPVIKLKGNELKPQTLAMIENGQEMAIEQNLGNGIFIFVKDIEIVDY